MKYIKHIILTAFVMVLATASVWALPRKYSSGTVGTDALVVGDTLMAGVTVEQSGSATLTLLHHRYATNGIIGMDDKTFYSWSPYVIGANGAIGNYTPITSGQNPGDAWVVVEGGNNVIIAGISVSIPKRCDSEGLTWCFQMPRGYRVLRTIWKQEAGLAYAKADTTVYLEFPFLGQELTNPNNLYPVTYSITSEYGNPTGNVINSQTGEVTLHGTGIDTVKAIFPGNNDYLPDTATYIIRTIAPYTLTLNKTGNGTVKAEGASGGNKTIIDHSSIIVDSCSGCSVCTSPEGCGNLFDGITSGTNKWGTDSAVKYVEFHTTAGPQLVNGYTLYTGDDNANSWGAGRNPKSWVLKAKSGDEWITIANVSNDNTMQDVNYTPFDFNVDVPGTYQYFRLEVSAIHSGNFMQLGEMQLFYEEADSVVVKNNEYYVIPGAKVTVTATPEALNYLVNWTKQEGNAQATAIAGAPNIAATSTTFAVIANTVVSATFAPYPTLKLVADATTMGTVELVGSPSGVTVKDATAKEYYVEPNTSVTVSATPYAAYYFVNWNSATARNSNVAVDTTFTVVTDDVTLTGHFAAKPTLTLVADGNGKVVVDSVNNALPAGVVYNDDYVYEANTNTSTRSYRVDYGTTLNIVATPEAGYCLLEWENHTKDSIRTVGSIVRDTTFTAYFGLPTPGLTPEGKLTTLGGEFVSETGEIVGRPRITETGGLIDESVVPVPVPVINGVDLSALTDNYVAKDGDTLTGTLNANVKISIAAGATVKLADVTINGTNSNDYNWAGITCEGNATIILMDGTENTVKGFYEDYPGIYVPVGSTLTIQGGSEGTGVLIASSNGNGAGIGGGWSGSYSSCGNINIQGGNVTAYGGYALAGIGGGRNGSCGTINITGGNVKAYGGDDAAGIGGSRAGSCGTIEISGGTVLSNGGKYGAGIGSGIAEFGNASCGNILISGGTITATGGEEAAGIGGGSKNGYLNQCGTITITAGVISVTATKGQQAPNSIGAGAGGTCGTVTIEPGANVTQN